MWISGYIKNKANWWPQKLIDKIEESSCFMHNNVGIYHCRPPSTVTLTAQLVPSQLEPEFYLLAHWRAGRHANKQWAMKTGSCWEVITATFLTVPSWSTTTNHHQHHHHPFPPPSLPAKDQRYVASMCSSLYWRNLHYKHLWSSHSQVRTARFYTCLFC